LRLLLLLDRLDLTVSDLTALLNQSQPRISRHLKALVDAGLVRRFQEGAWAYFRAIDQGPARMALDGMLDPLDRDDGLIAEDMAKLDAIRQARSDRAAGYFAQNADQWNAIRAIHIAEDAVETAVLEMGLANTPKTLLDLGTGTGRMLELFGPHVERGTGIDTSRDMLALARAALERHGDRGLTVRLGDVYGDHSGIEGGSFNLIVLHQVLHFLEEPAIAMAQAAEVLARDGRMVIVDFAPHSAEFLRDEHAHRRLGVSSAQVGAWGAGAGLKVVETRRLPPPDGARDKLTVMVWSLTAS
jgi:ArsR family transcriptional regulator